MPSAIDDFTPREVWAEYARRKAALDPSMGAWAYEDAVAALAAELGCGTPEEDLTEAQRLARQRIVEAAREAQAIAPKPGTLSQASRVRLSRDAFATASDSLRATRGSR